MDFKYSKVLQNEATPKVEMLFFGEIGGESLNGDQFATELKFIYDVLGIHNIDIYINTVGGSVFQGYSVLAVMDMLIRKGANINTHDAGIAYSMGGVLLAAGKKRTAFDYSTGMIHDPLFSGVGEDELSDTEKELLNKIKDSIQIILSNNTGLSKKTILAMMKKETFMNAKEMESQKMIDEKGIIETGRSIKNNLGNLERMAACADLYNEKSIKKMNRLNNALKLNSEASEEAQVVAVTELIGKAEKLKTVTNELELEKAKTLNLENKVKKLESEQNRVKAETLIDKAIDEARISKDSREMWIEDAMQDFERTEKKIKLLNAKPAKINDQLTSEDDIKLAKEYGELIDKNPALLDTIDPVKLKAMEAAFDKIGNKAKIVKIQ